jgi:DNA-binding beta-propeller fold protein YncE
VGIAIDAAQHTIYVANPQDNTVSVVDSSSCTAIRTSGCGQASPTVPLGNFPLFPVLDAQTHTVYIDNGFENTVSMIDTDSCNAGNTSGCSAAPPTVTVGNGPGNPAIDLATNTIYVNNFSDGTVSVINGNTCNAGDTAGCAQTHTIPVGPAPAAVAVDQTTDTVYVPDMSNGTVSVIRGATCNSVDTSGCGQTPATISGVGINLSAVAIDEKSDTVYVSGGPTGSDQNLGSVALIDGATCNGANHSGCDQTPQTTPVGSNPIWVTEDPATDTVYVLNQEDSDLSVIDAATCNAATTDGCVAVPPALTMGFIGGTVEVDQTTNTIYATSQATNSVSVLDGAHCNAHHTEGCARSARATTVGTAPQGMAVDQSTNTVYAGNRTDDDLSVIDTTKCNAGEGSACGAAWPTVATGVWPQAVAFDGRTDTAYTANVGENFNGGDTVSAIDGASCNSRAQSGCGKSPADVTVGNIPFALGVDEATNTIYVANIADGTVSVINGATCNGTDHSGCGQTPPAITVGPGPAAIAVDDSTDTIYVANNWTDTVSVINGATCNGVVHYGCSQTPATITVGNAPLATAVDQRTHTLYVETSAGAVSFVDTTACNADHTSGCTQTPPTVAVDGFTFGIAIDQATDDVYVPSVRDSSVYILAGADCNAGNSTGCKPRAVPARMGGFGGNVVIDQAAHTFYVPDNGDGNVSYFRLGQ